jgi:hypothetical protein
MQNIKKKSKFSIRPPDVRSPQAVMIRGEPGRRDRGRWETRTEGGMGTRRID